MTIKPGLLPTIGMIVLPKSGLASRSGEINKRSTSSRRNASSSSVTVVAEALLIVSHRSPSRSAASI